MGRETDIQWCDSTVNPTMGCDGCELWSKTDRVCYAGTLHDRYGGVNKGFSPTFDKLTFHPGRMAKAAAWTDLTGTDRPGKPWLDGRPRHIFVSDMSDALSRDVTFEFLKSEVIDVVASEKGRRHVWMWLTKRPARMAEFVLWLNERGVEWPGNIMAGTSVTDQQTTDSRLRQLFGVPGRLFISIEPLWGAIDYLASWLVGADDRHLRPRPDSDRLAPRSRSLRSFALVIIGGQSGKDARTFNLAHARDLIAQCRAAGVPAFIKQLGARPITPMGAMAQLELKSFGGDPAERFHTLKLRDGHGGDWSEWPADLRVRQFPAAPSPTP